MKKIKKHYKPKKKQIIQRRRRLVFFILCLPIVLVLFITVLNMKETEEMPNTLIPDEYIPIYKAAEKEFGVPWYLLAAHHRVETIFSTMDPMVSSAGAEGPMQFMPCTFVGWEHPTCKGLGKGNIPNQEKTDPEVIKKYHGYGVDANGDGKADPFDVEDAIFSAANYLAHYGAADGEIEKAVFAYNHSDQYVQDILYYAELYKKAYEEK